jgi:hypothetical protein
VLVLVLVLDDVVVVDVDEDALLEVSSRVASGVCVLRLKRKDREEDDDEVDVLL